MRRLVLVLTLMAALFAGGTLSARAAEDPQQVVATAPGHAQMTDQGGPAQADGLCNAYYRIGGGTPPPGYPR
jgi:hypothetical protein